MIEKKRYTSKALLNEKKIWKNFDKLSFKTKRKDKKEIERIETKRFLDHEESRNSKVVKSLKSSFSQRKTFITSQFIFELKNASENKRIETKSVESSLSVTKKTLLSEIK
jgi:hypothetical protein